MSELSGRGRTAFVFCNIPGEVFDFLGAGPGVVFNNTWAGWWLCGSAVGLGNYPSVQTTHVT